MPNSIIPPGRLIPAGQLWGGNPVRFVRNLTEDEKWKNYNESYTNGVKLDGHDSKAVWPKQYLEKAPQAPKDALSESDYVEQHYFKKGLFQ